ncbi:hypothetical protein D5018_02270 [Parashewanella curva]|uniref:Uncharacterized protein n=1 Tax=Parashewanella curva TaxID=2338552 RepID=A0A3L8Q170_9GAMM|nr:hypothetical protein [Parashewanella curva]RLV61324.1 hypothetical protein D5018_02270 [Parashewanella curva]
MALQSIARILPISQRAFSTTNGLAREVPNQVRQFIVKVGEREKLWALEQDAEKMSQCLRQKTSWTTNSTTTVKTEETSLPKYHVTIAKFGKPK